MPVSNFMPARLTQARKANKLNMTELAERMGLTRQAISQFEGLAAAPSAATVFRLAKELNVAESFFSKPVTTLEREKESAPSFRSMASATAKSRVQAETFLEFSVLLCSELFKYIEVVPPRLPGFTIPNFADLTHAEIEKIAEETRRFFEIGDGPISNLTLLLENRGVIIVKARIDARLEGLSQWYGGRPFVLLDNNEFCARSRYSLAHELGHLILHRGLSEQDLTNKALLRKIEDQADYYAGCFLLPEASFSSEFYGADWDSLVRLKSRWLVSIAAIVMRLHNLHLISAHQKTRLFQLINVRKARRVEPLDRDLPVEKPRLFQKTAELLAKHKLLRLTDWPAKVGLPADLLSDLSGIAVKDFQKAEDHGDVGNVVYLKR